MKIKAYAKINLALDVLGVRDDGYHELRMIMTPLDMTISKLVIAKKWNMYPTVHILSLMIVIR